LIAPERDIRRSRLTTISAMPNRPMAIGAKSMPSESSGMSKVKRCAPVLTSVPTKAEQQAEEHHRDRLQHRATGQHHGGHQAERHQRAIVLPGPNFCAIRVSGSAKITMMIVPMVPAKTSRRRRSTAPHRHGRCAPSGSRRGRSRPTEASPGRLTRIEVVEPPYCAP
jgi:hypothetical protein